MRNESTTISSSSFNCKYHEIETLQLGINLKAHYKEEQNEDTVIRDEQK